MPLAYDDIPGSWAIYSKDWIAIHDPTGDIRQLVIKANLVPYGSYVTVGEVLRVETIEQAERVYEARYKQWQVN